MDKVFLVNKPVGLTSYDVVYKVKKKLNIKRVGHTGTLDPFASGLLLVCTGEATKIARFLEAERKQYIASIKLGASTDTGDLTGNITQILPVNEYSNDFIQQVLNRFLGESEQIPPMYSAIKINGKKLYELARKGEEIDRKSRKIFIYSINLLNYDKDIITFEVEVSKGTYIRTLGEDIAKALGSIGHLIELKRTSIGQIKLESACDIDSLSSELGVSINDILEFPKFVATREQEKDIKNGKRVALTNDNEYILFVNEDALALAIYRKDGDAYCCERGFNL